MGDGRHLGQGPSLTTSGPCASGCVQPGHDGCGPDAAACECACNRPGPWRQPCDTAGGCGPHAPDPDCPGCLPRPAVKGVFCDRCNTRLATALDVAAGLVVHLRACLLPGVGVVTERGEEQHTKAPAAPAPVNLSAVDHADRIYVALRAAVGLACSELGMVGPEDQPAWRTFDPDNGMWTVAGLPLGSTGREAAPYVHWLTAHLDTIVTHSWAADFVTDTDDCVSLATVIHRAGGAFPTVDRPAFLNPSLERASCPRCELRSLHRTPPDIPGAPVLVTCISPTCSWTGTDEDITSPEPGPDPSLRRAS